MNKITIALAQCIQDPTVTLALLMLAFLAAFVLHVWIEEKRRAAVSSKKPVVKHLRTSGHCERCGKELNAETAHDVTITISSRYPPGSKGMVLCFGCTVEFTDLFYDFKIPIPDDTMAWMEQEGIKPVTIPKCDFETSDRKHRFSRRYLSRTPLPVVKRKHESTKKTEDDTANKDRPRLQVMSVPVCCSDTCNLHEWASQFHATLLPYCQHTTAAIEKLRDALIAIVRKNECDSSNTDTAANVSPGQTGGSAAVE